MEVEAGGDHVALVVQLLVCDVLIFRLNILQPNVSICTVDRIRLWLNVIGRLVLFEPLIDPLIYFFLSIAVPLLNFSLKLVATPLDI